MQDLPLLFTLLGEGKIKPIITVRLPLLEAAKANQLLSKAEQSPQYCASCTGIVT